MADLHAYKVTYTYNDVWQHPDIEVHASTKAMAKAQAINEIKGKIRIVDVVREEEPSDSDILSGACRL